MKLIRAIVDEDPLKSHPVLDGKGQLVFYISKTSNGKPTTKYEDPSDVRVIYD